FAVACCRRIWNLLNTKQNRRAVEISERYADGLTCEQELVFARDATGYWRIGVASRRQRQAVQDRVAAGISSYVAGTQPRKSAPNVARTALWLVSHAASKTGLVANPDAYKNWLQKQEESKAAERLTQANILHCIFRNPFRPSTPFPPAVLTWND